MIKLIQQISLVTILVCTNTVFAGTVVQIRDNSGLITILTDGKFARMNMSAEEYIIVDYKKYTINVVNSQKKQVMLLSAEKSPTGKSKPQLLTSLKKLGAGTTVAGYTTQKYAYAANGKSCGIIYGSAEAYQKPGMKELLLAMKKMMENQLAVLGDFAGLVDDCALADMKLSDFAKTTGVPMRTEKNGMVASEVESIKLGVNFPADLFVIPAFYQSITMQQQMREAKQQIQQQSGQMSPEMMQQLQQVQEKMMQQYQKP